MDGLRARTRYDPGEVEPAVTARWLASGLHHPESGSARESCYSIAIPPPNVTGALHMGHALNGAIQDTLIRRARQRGLTAKWILGTDHAGIATQTQVERRLVAEGTTRAEIGRDAFVARAWDWRDEHGGTIIEQYKRLGATCDYDDERFTLDSAYAGAVLKVFVELYEQGLVYRDHYMVNWDPGSGSAISDLEVEERDVADTLFHIAYPVEGGGELVVATVRPETMLADTAVAVHPDDERYSGFIGRTAILPLVGRRLPIIADEYVKPEFGTGALKITPGHDPNDFEIGRRHGLEEIGVIGEDGTMNDAAGEFAGLAVLDARERVVAALGDAVRRREPYVHTVPFSHRSGERIEPLISLQWFVRMDALAGPAAGAVRDGRVQIHPESQSRRYLDWLDAIRPWCISRQLWWGHQIPVWYRGEETHCGVEPPVGDGWERDPDVLDTWFSSALWPFATLGWPAETPDLRSFYPTDVLLTARDILFLWVARMVMAGLRFTGDVPFRHVYVHTVIQAPDGRRMSKSLGTGIDPLALIEGGPRPPVFEQGGDFPAYGADAVRFGLLAMSSTQDVRFSEEKVAQGAALANKLFNASRLVLTKAEDAAADVADAPLQIEDRWIRSRLEAAKTTVQDNIDAFDFSKAAFALYDFVFGELCDWYLEMVKPRAAGAGLREHLLAVLRDTLALVHPIMPFVTEELWAHVPGVDGLLAQHVAAPADAGARDADAERTLAAAIEAVSAVRSWRDGAGVASKEVLEARIEGIEADGAELVARLARVALVDDDRVAAAVVAAGAVRVAILTDVVDHEAAARKVAERRREIEVEIARAEAKLANAGFVAKAPPAVVDAERAKLAHLRTELDHL